MVSISWIGASLLRLDNPYAVFVIPLASRARAPSTNEEIILNGEE